MKIDYIRIRLFFKTVRNGIVGISLEVLLAIVFIFVGFLVSLLWWSLFR